MQFELELPKSDLKKNQANVTMTYHGSWPKPAFTVHYHGAATWFHPWKDVDSSNPVNVIPPS